MKIPKIRIVVIVLALALCVFEILGISYKMELSRQRHTDDLVAQLGDEINRIDAAINKGDEAQLKSSFEHYKTLAKQLENQGDERAAQLVKSSKKFTRNFAKEQKSAIEVVKLRAATRRLERKLNALSGDITADNVAQHLGDLRQAYQAYSAEIAVLEFSSTTKQKDELVKYADEVASLAYDAAICVNVCPSASYQSKIQRIGELKPLIIEQSQVDLVGTREIRKSINEYIKQNKE